MKKTFKLTQSKLLTALAANLLAASALAQDINIDYRNNFGVPGPLYGGAAGMPGVWNNPPNPAPFPLVDTAGLPTGAMIFGAAAGFFACNDPATGFAHTHLYDDGLALGPAGTVRAFIVGPLAPGDYEVFTYAWSPCQPAYLTDVAVLGSASLSPTIIGGPWPGGHVPGVTYAHHALALPAGGFITIQLTTIAGNGSLNGIQIKQLP